MIKKLFNIFPILIFTFIYISPCLGDTAKEADLLFNEGKKLFKNYKYNEALKKFLPAAEIDIKLGPNRKTDLGNNYTVIGRCYAELGKYESALSYYKKALDIFEKLGKRKSISIVLNNTGTVYFQLGKYNETVKYLQKALAIDEEMGNKNNICVRLNNIGQVYKKWGQYKRAIENYQKALVIAKKIKRKDQISILLNNIGTVYDDWGQYNKAIEYYQEALNIDKELGNKEGVSVRLNNLGFVYSKIGKYDKAIEYYQEALAIGRELGREDKIATLFNNIGIIYAERGQYDKAVEYYRKALDIARKLGNKSGIATRLNNIGIVYKEWGQYDRAIEYFQKAYAIDREIGRKHGISIELNNLGLVYKIQGKYDKAIEYYQKSLALSKEMGRKESIAICLNNIGLVYAAWGEYDKAVEYYHKTLNIYKEMGQKRGVETVLNNIGKIHELLGQYDSAIEYYQQALDVARKIGKKGKTSLMLSNIGTVYSAWGKFDKAIEYYKKALAIDEELGQKGNVPGRLSSIGLVYKEWKQYDRAMEYFQKALYIDRKLCKKPGIAARLNNIGLIYRRQKKYEMAIENYKKALAINKELGKKSNIATNLNNIGFVYKSSGQYKKAIEYLQKALKINEEIGRKSKVAIALNNIGSTYRDLKEYKKAAEYFNKSIAIKEELRLTATGNIRRDYLASQIYTYQELIDTYVSDNEPEQAFDIVELSSAKYLIEQIGEKLKDENFKPVKIKRYQKKLNNTTAIINYANINRNEPAVIFVGKKLTYTAKLDKKKFTDNAIKHYKETMFMIMDNLRGIKIEPKNDMQEEGSRLEKDNFEKALNYYRVLLSKPELSKREAVIMKLISKELYTLLFGNIEKYLEGKIELIILPDDILSFLPFETIIMPDGRYLVEKYHIKYTQSLTVSELISKRKYTKKRKNILAFGGAVYDRISYKTDMIESEKQLESLQKQTLLALNRGNSIRKTYDTLGISELKNLPGTLIEVKQIKKIIRDTDIYTGESADEYNIKSLSRKGTLKKYRVLHFATHGLVVPEIPELSAIVLSLFKQERDNEDGYLRMNEIANLNINADFVNLSACETGLGKIYGGEGVVGLTQSFLVAGANGLSVSLWQVSDESTMIFMIEMYKLVNEKKINYDKAITEMKRKFISGSISNKYKNPFYWAPFVYYGN